MYLTQIVPLQKRSFMLAQSEKMQKKLSLETLQESTFVYFHWRFGLGEYLGKQY